jgi:hypothetical protein
MSFSSTTYTAPSGAFASVVGYKAGESVAGSFVQVYNPTVLDRYVGSYGTTKAIELGSDEWTAALNKYSKPITRDDFEIYGQRLIELTTHIQENPTHCSLGPLRGAAKPCVTAEVMSRGEIKYDFFNFQENSNRTTHQRIITNLTEILKARNPGEKIFKINITDTSKGGQGINNLVDFLAHIRNYDSRFGKQLWKLDLNLFFDNSKNTDLRNIYSVLSKQTPGIFEIQLNPYEVSSLIVEDFDPALAFVIEWDGKRHAFKPCSVPGQFLYQVNNELRLIECDNSYLALEEFYSKAITENMLTAPNLEQVGVVWQEYQNK